MKRCIVACVLGMCWVGCRIDVPEGVLPCREPEDCPIHWVCAQGSCARAPGALRDAGAQLQRYMDDAAVGEPLDAALALRDLSVDDEQLAEAGLGLFSDEPDAETEEPSLASDAGRSYATQLDAAADSSASAHTQCEPESCVNVGVDSDCDGTVDEGLRLGQPCSATQGVGACASGVISCLGSSEQPTCAAGQPTAESCNATDDDCDGEVDEGYALLSDVLHCGACDVRCGEAEVCCAGSCQAVLPADYGAACGGKCDDPGRVQCDGSCSRSDPVELGMPCGHCGGTIQCDGRCSEPDPPGYGERCRDGISTIGCSGSCECLRECLSGELVACALPCPIVCRNGSCN